MEAEALLEAAREAQLQLLIRNDVSKLPLWFGPPLRTQLQVVNGLSELNVHSSPQDGMMTKQ